MRWGKKRGGNPDSLEDRYRTLGRLIEQRGFASQGLMTIEVEGGYVIRGLRADGRELLVTSDTIALDELLAELEELTD